MSSSRPNAWIRDALLLAAGTLLGAILARRLARTAGCGNSKSSLTPAPTPPSSSATATSSPASPSDDARCASKTYRIPAPRLRAFAAAVFASCGVDPADAREAADILVSADLRGIDSHGVARLKAYFTMLRTGKINPRPVVRVVAETASTATVDGDNGLGLVVAPKANAIAMRKAAECGSGWVAVRNTNHYGIAGAYSLRAVRKGLIGFSMTNTSPIVAPLWGKARMLGTNPIAVAFPTGDPERPMILDLATSVVPFGKVEECARIGAALLNGWAIDAQGADCTSPEEVMADGALRTLGGDRAHSGHKGYCLSAMVDVLSAVLSGGSWGPHAGAFTTDRTNYGSRAALDEGHDNMFHGIGHFFGCLRVDGFRDATKFRDDMDRWCQTFRGSPAVDPARPVQVPGDPEWEAEAARGRDGVPVKLSVVAQLLEVSRDSGVAPPLDPSAVDLRGVKTVKVVL